MTDVSTIPGPPCNAIAATRRAFYLPSKNSSLFVWLHTPESSASTHHGVLICPPALYKHVHAHRSLRHLAEDLADAGMTVCRLDYDGTGDSAGSVEDPDRLATWIENIQDAIAWMRKTQGCRTISVLGMRLGALLAMKATHTVPVDNLVLWAPVVKGRLFVREMQALGLTALPAPIAEESNDIEAAGFVISEQTARDLATLDALTLRPQCPRALIVARDDLAEDRRLLDHLKGLGIETQQTRQPGFLDMIAEPHKTAVPENAIAFMTTWLAADTLHDDEAPAVCGSVPATAMNAADYREQIVVIEGETELFGILTEPNALVANRPLVVLLNAGAAYRIGPNRLHVLLARQLARTGFRCLRVDLAGLGDSLAANASSENNAYAATMFRDIDAILQHATQRLGASQVVMAGLCSGAYAAFQAAAQFANPALVECLLINPLYFFFKEGMSLEMPEVKEHAAFHYYARSAMRPGKWWKLITGQSTIGIMGAFRMLGRRFHRRSREECVSTSAVLRQVDAAIQHPERDDASGDLKRAAARRHLAFFFSAHDPGYSLLKHQARQAVKSLTRSGAIDIAFIPNADHTFSRRQPRQAAIQAISQHLAERYIRAETG